MTARGTLDALFVPVARAVAGVADLVAADDVKLFGELGYKLPQGGDLQAFFAPLVTSAGELAHALTAVLDAYQDGSYEQPSFLPKVIELGIAVKDTVQTATQLPGRAAAAFAAAQAFVANAGLDRLPQRLIDYLVVHYLRREQPAIASFLEVLGLSAQTFVAEGDYNPDFHLIEVRWDRLSLVVSDPGELFTREYAWGTAAFDVEALVDKLEGFLWLIGIAAIGRETPPGLELPLVAATVETPADGLASAELGVRLRRADAPAGDETDVGLALVPYAQGEIGLEIDLGAGWKLTADAGLAAEGLSIAVRPHSGVELDATTTAAGSLGVGIVRDGAIAGPIVLFGNAGGTRMEIGQVAVTLRASVDASGPDAGFEITLGDVALVLVASEGDGFLQKVLPTEPLVIGFDLKVGASARKGFYVDGGAGFEKTFHLNAEIGPLFVNSITLAARIDAAGATVQLTATGGLALGPVTAVVQEIGLRAALVLGASGNLGNADLALAFKPPTGIGLSIDTSAVKAGGFLSIDTEAGRYVGAIELSILDTLDLTAIGIITTKLPDGSPGFSLLFLIGIRFPVPVPLGYNFYFSRAGGLLGLNRGADLDRLRDGLRAGTLDNILFPSDVVRRVDAIVRDLDAVFPIDEGQFLVGPMAEITWSTPPLITGRFGLVIEIGTPFRVAILGTLRLALPTADEAIVDLKLAFLGTIDFAAGLLTFDASIYDSYLGRGSFKLYLEGDIALRISWGAQKDFVTSIGGFHPSFTPGAFLHLPSMRRLTLSLLKDNPRITLTTYFAITTNTVQLGARLEFVFRVSKFAVVGDFGFDVLFQFSPFHIDAAVWARLAVMWGDTDLLSISLDFRLQGPNPWIASGKASFKILFVEVSVRFTKKFGEEAHDTLPDVEVLPAILAELEQDSSWQGALGAGAQAIVALRPISGPLVIDAGGRLSVSQKILPLATEFTWFGTSRPTDAREVRIQELRIGSTVAETAPLFESFAPAAFRELDDKAKLKAPAYEQRPAGVRASGGQELRTDHVAVRPVRYEQIVSDAQVTTRATVAGEPAAVFGKLAAGGAAGHSPAAKARALQRETGTVLGAAAPRARYFVAQVSDLRPIGADLRPADPVSVDLAGRPVFAAGVVVGRADADARLAELVHRGRRKADLEVLPEAQLAA